MKSLKQKIDGKGNIQVGRDVIMNIVNEVHSFNDIDQAITDLHLYIDSLRWKRGWTDNFVLLALAVGAAIATGLKLWNIWTTLLFTIALFLLYVGGRIRRSVDKIESEIKAADLILIELYRQKIIQQINGMERLY